MSYEIVCLASGDRAEALDQEAALVAASTLAEDHARAMRGRGALDVARRSIVILRDGVRANALTLAARSGERQLWAVRVDDEETTP